LTNEAGLHLDHRSNLSNDIAIYETRVLTPDKINRKYVDVPPKIAIEIDIDGDVEHLTEAGYIYKKTQKMLTFGTEKVVWVLTAAQVVIVATNEKIETFNWHKDIELMVGQSFNIGQYLDKKGIVVE
jgi:Uma2 family endonuclease